ncbi:hypothetical protein AVEN_59829-1 [Araneus ventricosus]|uniref:Uncharacterized protein n=1 Tax=Araneus ventricosus TaxID=182803 RepID=A0A4Y2QTK8_ARAVE|nr:hypothetical protein AVEN_5011-1 [Araneus ventricosus]GBN66734.1 hypothetical protein AVEN_59829-1 [Araneus ventricosus]
MEILKHGKEKSRVKVENLWKIEQRLGKVGFPTKPNSGSSCAESLVGPLARIVSTSNDLTRSRPCYEGIKSEIRGVGKGIGGSKSSCRGGKKIALPYCQRTLEL